MAEPAAPDRAGAQVAGSGKGRPALLWLWRDQPTRFGAGSQQRAAHILLALSEHFDVHAVIVRAGGRLGATGDADLLARLASFEEIVAPAIDGNDGSPAGAGDVPDRIVAIARRRGAVATMIVTFELAVFLRSVLADLEPAFLELDELMSQRQRRFLATPGLSRAKADEFRRGLRLIGLLERQLLPQVRGVIVSSTLEKSHLRGAVADDRVSVVPNATHHGAPLAPAPSAGLRTIMFVGRMDYFPNPDAVRFFLGEVWPELRQRYGDRVRFHVVGAGAPPGFRPEDEPGVAFDRNRADILPVYRDASVAVAPIRAGGGTRVKILEAFALGRPVVSTTMGAEGLGVEHGRHLLIADTAVAFAEACASLLDDPELAARLVANAADWVRRHHSTDAVRAAVADSILVRGPGG
ncbi:MAG: glycosyltransferase [Bauldia sp.]